MIPLVDIHCHLLAGLDDGPQSDEDAMAMCKMAYEDGTRWICAGAHQNDHYPAVTPDVIRKAAADLKGRLRAAGVHLSTMPCAEIMAHIDMEANWREGKLLSMADRKQFLLVEMPDGMFVELGQTITDFAAMKIRIVLAHPERQPELLHGNGTIEDWIRLGALVQVSADSVTRPHTKADGKALRRWFRQGIVHAMGSDGHSPRRRSPRMGAAYHEVCRWAGQGVADRVFSTNGMAILQGLPVRFSMPEKPKMAWFSRLFG
jgi:protein-tyrosine phosphatase